jgi:salicylate 5-hydroxylase small subunit
VSTAPDTLFHDPYYQRHVVGAPRVLAVDDDGIRCEASYVVFRTKRDAMAEILSAGRYLDRIVRTMAACCSPNATSSSTTT